MVNMARNNSIFGKCLLAAGLLLGGAGAAYAEGRCPPGQYPIGGQGMLGCAPIPPAAGAPRPRASGKWHDQWGAVSLSYTARKMGHVSGMASKSLALKAAKAHCETSGAQDCTDGFAYSNGCVALLGPEPGKTGKTGMGAAATVEEAIQVARRECPASDPGGCAVAYQECSLPVFQEY